MIFGPVPSRRLGMSLGINNIPAKTCTYSCIYCQIGKTTELTIERRFFYEPDEILYGVKKKLEKGIKIDYLAFVPDGEPTLDINLGVEIEKLRELGYKIAVISNASLLWKKDVMKDVMKADWVSLKIDAVSKSIWRKINRPHPSLSIDRILDGIEKFLGLYEGDVVTETMLVKGINDGEEELQRLAEFLEKLDVKSYISVPIRPPAEKWVRKPDEDVLNMAYQIFGRKTEFLTSYEGNEFLSTGDVERDLLAIMSVHPMREDAVKEMLRKVNRGWEVMERLLNEGKIVEKVYNGKKFYVRRFFIT